MKQAAKLREAFDLIRNKNNNFSLRARLVVLVAAEIVGSVLLAAGVAWLLEVVLPDTVKIPLVLELIVFSLLIGSLVTTFMSKLFFDPIKRLGDAMEKVADGDLTVRIETRSSSKEIQEI